MKNILKYTLWLLIPLVLGACTFENHKKYAISTDEALQAYLSKDDILSVEKVANILLCKHATMYQFVDLRTPPEFIKSHISGAINIPAKNVLDMEYYKTLNQSEKINVLYCRGKNEAINIYMILKQLGFKNIKVALGGFDYIDKFVLNHYGVKSGDYNDEKPKYDYLRLVVGIDKPTKVNVSAPELQHKNPNKVIKDFDESCPDLN